MNIMKTIADKFRTATKSQPVDRYNILSPLLATGEYVSSVSELVKLISASNFEAYVKGMVKVPNAHVQKSVNAYKDYVKNLQSHEQSLEKARPLSSVLLTLQAITNNVTQIEDNFPALFGDINTTTPETTMRSGSLVVIGYTEKADAYVTWLSNLVEHITADDHALIPPFRSKELVEKAPESAEFANFNIHKWNAHNGGLLGELKEMQKKGADLTIQSADGTWIDDYAHDSQFSNIEQQLITASFRSPILAIITWNHVRTQDKIDLLTSRKNWLTSKIIMEQSKLRGMDPESAEFKQLKKAVDRYSDMVSKHEQQIERMRA